MLGRRKPWLAVEVLEVREETPSRPHARARRARLAGPSRRPTGDRFEIRGPGGRSFSWDVEDGGPLLLVAGGAGLVPLRAMLRHRHAQGADLETRLVLSVRSEEDLLYRDELAEWEAAGVQMVVTFTRTGPRRRVDRELLEEAGPAAHVFVCGSTAFVESAAALLMGLGHDPALVRTERFGGAA